MYVGFTRVEPDRCIGAYQGFQDIPLGTSKPVNNFVGSFKGDASLSVVICFQENRGVEGLESFEDSSSGHAFLMGVGCSPCCGTLDVACEKVIASSGVCKGLIEVFGADAQAVSIVSFLFVCECDLEPCGCHVWVVVVDKNAFTEWDKTYRPIVWVCSLLFLMFDSPTFHYFLYFFLGQWSLLWVLVKEQLVAASVSSRQRLWAEHVNSDFADDFKLVAVGGASKHRINQAMAKSICNIKDDRSGNGSSL